MTAVVTQPEVDMAATNNAQDAAQNNRIVTIQNFMMQCREVSFSIKWFSTSVQAEKQTKAAMIDSADAKEDGYSIAKRLMSSKHPMIAELNAARSAITQFRDSITLVKAGDVTQQDEDSRPVVARGVRLIRNQDIQEFEAGFEIRKQRLLKAVENADRALRESVTISGTRYDSIIEMDKKRLGKGFNENDYPTSLIGRVTVTDPVYRDYTAPLTLPRAVYERQLKLMQQELNQTVTLVSSDLTSRVRNIFTDLVVSMSRRVTINPQADDEEYGQYKGCDILSIEDDDNRDLVIKIRQKVSGGEWRIITLPTMTEEEYKTRLCPEIERKSKSIHSSTVETMLEHIRTFERFSSMLGEPGASMAATLEDVRSALHSMSRRRHSELDADTLAEELRNNERFNAKISRALVTAVEDLQAADDSIADTGRKLDFDNVLIGDEQ